MLKMEQYHNPVYTGPLPQFPEDPTLPEGAKEVYWKDTEHRRVDMKPDLVYAERDGETLHVHLLLPVEGSPYLPQEKCPLIVFVQGSGWRRQQVFQKLGTMVRFCEQGFAVAMVEYRPSDVAPFPAQVQDVKTAIRFLRKNADALRLKTEKIALWGDSSGAHTALIAGITGDSGPDTADYGTYSAEVACIVDWYAPVDLVRMTERPSVADHGAPDSNESLVLGGVPAENPGLAAAANPLTYLSKDQPTPPVLILHGSQDHIVPFHQSVLLYEKLRELGKEVEFIKVKGGFHAFGGFHCDEARTATREFIEKHIGN